MTFSSLLHFQIEILAFVCFLKELGQSHTYLSILDSFKINKNKIIVNSDYWL